MGTYIKIIHIIITIVAGLTVGIVLSTFIALAAFFNTLIDFPLTVYKNLAEAEKVRRLSQVFVPNNPQSTVTDDDMWDRHIRRMEEKKKNETES